MESFRRGWSFLQQAWKMAAADRDLIKPSIYALFVGFIVGLIGIVPFVIVTILFQDGGTLSNIIYAVLGGLLAFSQYVVTYVFSAMTVYLIYGYLSEGDGRMDKAWEIVRRDWLDILSLAAASALVSMVQNWVRNQGRRRDGLGGALAQTVANLLQTVWTEATYLILPAMVIEDINLKGGVQRAAYIVRNNLLLVGVSTIGVRWVTGLISFVLGFIGIALGVGLALPIIALSNGALIGIVVGVGLGVLVASLFFMTGAVISSYTSTAYHTCLYLWAREVEKAGQAQAGIPVNIPAPAPLAAVMGG
ncbi:MAG: DUF6159 family protein [Anaerolineales bacterium]